MQRKHASTRQHKKQHRASNQVSASLGWEREVGAGVGGKAFVFMREIYELSNGS